MGMRIAFLSICIGAYPEPKGLVIKHIAESVNRNIQLNEEHQISSEARTGCLCYFLCMFLSTGVSFSSLCWSCRLSPLQNMDYPFTHWSVRWCCTIMCIFRHQMLVQKERDSCSREACSICCSFSPEGQRSWISNLKFSWQLEVSTAKG